MHLTEGLGGAWGFTLDSSPPDGRHLHLLACLSSIRFLVAGCKVATCSLSLLGQSLLAAASVFFRGTPKTPKTVDEKDERNALEGYQRGLDLLM